MFFPLTHGCFPKIQYDDIKDDSQKIQACGDGHMPKLIMNFTVFHRLASLHIKDFRTLMALLTELMKSKKFTCPTLALSVYHL